MARRAGGRSTIVPGLIDALTQLEQSNLRTWGHVDGAPTEFAEQMQDNIEALERGDPITVSGREVWRALFQAGSPYAELFFSPHPQPFAVYEIAGRGAVRLVRPEGGDLQD